MMKKLILIFVALFSVALSAQSTGLEIESALNERRLKADSLTAEIRKREITNTQLDFLTEARDAIDPVIKNVLSLDNFNNKPLQKTLMKPLTDKYYSAFDYESEGKKGNALRYGFINKDEFINHYKAAEALLLSKIIMKQYDVLIDYHEKSLQRTEEYINRNLKALGISRHDYDNLSENDARILQKQFK